MTHHTAAHSVDSTVRPFAIDVAQADLDELRMRLRATRTPTPLPDGSRATGVPQEQLDRLIREWIEFDWRAVEARLAAYGSVTTDVDGQTIHAVHARSPHTGATPLLLIHGWPGSFLEHVGLIERLTHPELHGGSAKDAFHVVIPSIPGFGFSLPVAPSADVSPGGIAGYFLELMTRLGYDRFVTQGGDLGAGIAPELGRAAPNRLLGVHVNGALGAFVSPENADSLGELNDLDRDRLGRIGRFLEEEFAYISLQGTRPALLGTLLSDSPAAQLAWIVDKLNAWTWPAEAPAEDVLGLDFVLANASLYWFTRSAGTAAYVGYAQTDQWGRAPQASGVPTAAIQFAHDVGIRAAAEQGNAITRWTDVTDRGGHFAALEEPQILVEDLRRFVRSLR